LFRELKADTMETEAKVCSRKERMEDIMFKFLAIKAPTDRIRNVREKFLLLTEISRKLRFLFFD